MVDFDERHKKLFGVIEKLGYTKADESKVPTGDKNSQAGKKYPVFSTAPRFAGNDTAPDPISAAFKFPGKE